MTTPETTAFMLFGFAVTFGILGVWGVMLAARWRSLRHDLEVLETLEREDG